MSTQIRGWRAHLAISPVMHPQAAAILAGVPGINIEDKGASTVIEIPAHAWGVVESFLTSYFSQTRHRVLYSTGWKRPRYRNDDTSLKMWPANLDPANVPGLNAEARARQAPHQVAALGRLFRQGATLEEIPTGGGKSFVALAAAAAARAIGWKVLIIAPSAENHWDAEIAKWLDPAIVGAVTVLRGQLGCEVRAYKAKVQERLYALVSEEEAQNRLPLKVKLGKLAALWAEGSEGWVCASDIGKLPKQRALDLGIVTQRTVTTKGARWVVWDGDTDLPVATYAEGYTTLGTDAEGNIRQLGPAEVAQNQIASLNSEIRSTAQVLIVSAGILTARRDALRKWGPDLVVYDESHEYKHWERWKRVPATEPGAKPTYYLTDTQAASAWWVAERASSVLLLSATPDPDRRRDLWSQYDMLDIGGWGSFREWTARYCGGRNQEVQPGKIAWNSSGEVRKGVPIPIDPAMDEELRNRAGLLHHITPRSVSHSGIPPINRRLIWLRAKDLAKPTKDPEWAVPIRDKRDKMNRLLDISAAMKQPWAVGEYSPRVLKGNRGIVLTGSHFSCERLGAAYLKKLGGKELTVNRRYIEHLQPIFHALKAPLKLEIGQVVEPLILTMHGGHGDRNDRYEALQRLLTYPGPALLVGTVDAWGQGWDGMQFLDFASILRLPWNQGRLLQAEGRFERMGGLFSVDVDYPLALGTIDERLLRTILGKAETSLRLFERDDLERMRHGLSEEESEDDIISAMFDSLLGPGATSGADVDFADEFDANAVVEAALGKVDDE